MYKHHQESIQNLITYFAEKPGIIAIVFGGSVAKGLEREDSDIDAMIIVTDEKFRELESENRLAECIEGYCTYPEGYFDIKYSTLTYLRTLAKRGSEPARNAYLCAKCLWTTEPEVTELVAKIPVFQKQEKENKMLSFYGALTLNRGYFWDSSKENSYLRHKTAADIVLFSLRMLLEENEVLFPCHKSLLQTVERLENKPEGLLEKVNVFLSTMTDESKEDFVTAVLNHLSYTPPEDFAEVLTRYVDDNELWWYKDRPVIAEW